MFFVAFILRTLLRVVFPLPPTVKVDQCLHAAPLHDFALKPDKVDRLVLD